MKSYNLKKKAPKQVSTEVSEKKSERKAMMIFVLVLIVAFLIIWFGKEYLANKSTISTSLMTLNGKERMIIFSEKKSGYTSWERKQDTYSEGPAHYGYFLELYEKGSDKPLNELKFKSPVRHIDRTPELIIHPNGIIWVVSTTDSYEKDSPGFVLKFSIREDKIEPVEFELKEKYMVRSIRGNKVMLSEGTGPYSTIYPEPLYVDLETSKVVDEMK